MAETNNEYTLWIGNNGTYSGTSYPTLEECFENARYFEPFGELKPYIEQDEEMVVSKKNFQKMYDEYFSNKKGSNVIEQSEPIEESVIVGEPTTTFEDIVEANEEVSFNEVPTTESEKDELILESLPVQEVDESGWFLNDGWFASHPDKVLGIPYESTGRYGKVTKYKGTIEDIDRIDVIVPTLSKTLDNSPLQSGESESFVQSTSITNPENQTFILDEIDESNKNVGKKFAKKKEKIGNVEDDSLVFNEPELQTFEDVWRTYNKGISKEELEVYIWHKTQIGRPLSRRWINLVHNKLYDEDLTRPERYNVDEEDINEWVKKGLLYYYEGKLVPAVEYLSGDMYDKKHQLDVDKEDIIEKYGEDVYNNQSTAFNNAWKGVYDNRLTIGQTDESLVVLPISRLASEFKINRLASFAEDSEGFKIRMVTAKSDKNFGKPDWNKDLDTPDYKKEKIESISLLDAFNYFLLKSRPALLLPVTHLDIVNYYCLGKSINIGSNNDDEKTKKENEAKKAKLKSSTHSEGERLFKLFLDTELEDNDKIRLETQWNSDYNNYKPIDLNKIPVAFNMCRKYKGEYEELKPEKREAVAFMMHKGSGCLAFGVGTGKTASSIFTMSSYLDAGYAKRLSVVVPNQVYKQFISEIKSFAPHIPVIDGYNLGNDYVPHFQGVDGNIINVPEGSITVFTYEGIEKIGFNQSTQDELMGGLYDILNQGGESERQQTDKQRASFYERLETILGKGLKGTTFTIEDFGFDFICYDEAHKMKKVFCSVKGEMEETSGGTEKRGRNPYEINSGTPSSIALKGFMLNYYIQQKNYGGNIMMLTATPFTNSPLEIFSMLSMVAYEKLKDTNLNNIKTFFDTYVKTSTELVINSKLKPEFKPVILGFNNLISLQSLIRRYINYKSGEEVVGMVRPRKYVLPYLSEMIDGVTTKLSNEDKIETFIPMTPLQEKLMSGIISYVEGKGELIAGDFSDDDEDESKGGSESDLDVDSLVYYPTVSKDGNKGFGKGIVTDIITKDGESKYQVTKVSKDWEETDNSKVAGIFTESELEVYVNDGAVEVDEDMLDEKEKAGVRTIKGLSYARNLALSPHLYVKSGLTKRPDYKSYIEMSPKLKYVMECIRDVKKYHESHNQPVSGQVIYMDRGVKFFPLIKEYLVKEVGYKEHEIGIIQSGLPKNGKRSKEYVKNLFNGEIYNEITKLFEPIPDEDRIKIVIGSSTIKEGINLQKFGTVLYNCFIDWNPTDIQQLEGRVWRQGNEFGAVRIVNPLVIDSADIFLFEKLRQKTSRLNTIWATEGKTNVLNLDEFNPEELKYALIRDPKVIAELKSIEAKAQIESDILGFTRQLEQVDKLKENAATINRSFNDAISAAEKYRNIELSSDKLQDAALLCKTIIEVEKTQKDKEGKKMAYSYDRNVPQQKATESWQEYSMRKKEYLDSFSSLSPFYKPYWFSSFALAVRDTNKMIKELVNQYDISFSIEDFSGLNAFKDNVTKNIEDARERQKYFNSDEFKKKEEDEVIAKRIADKIEYKPIEESVKDFAKLDYLLSQKKSGGEKKAIYTSCPPVDDKGVRLIDKSALAYLNECIEREGQTKDLYFNEDTKTYEIERQALHDKIIKDIFTGVKCVSQGKPIAVFTGGSPASGKSHFIKEVADYLTNESIFHLDADGIRAKLPEYKGWNASATHKETQYITNSILNNIGEGKCRYDFIYDGTMNKAEKYYPLIKKVNELGYDTYIIFMDIPYGVARSRALARYQKSGRYVPIEVIDDFFAPRPNSGGKTMGQYALDELKPLVKGYIVVDGITGDIIEKGGEDFPHERLYDSKPLLDIEAPIIEKIDEPVIEATVSDAVESVEETIEEQPKVTKENIERAIKGLEVLAKFGDENAKKAIKGLKVLLMTFKEGGEIEGGYSGNIDKAIPVKAGSVIITRGAIVDDNTKHEYEGEMLTNREVLSRINKEGGGVAFEKGGSIEKKDKEQMESQFGKNNI